MSQVQECKISGDDIRKLTEKFYEDFCAEINQAISKLFQSADFWETIKKVASQGNSGCNFRLVEHPCHNTNISDKMVKYFNLHHKQERNGLVVTLCRGKYYKIKVEWKEKKSVLEQKKFPESKLSDEDFTQECQRIRQEIIKIIEGHLSTEEEQKISKSEC